MAIISILVAVGWCWCLLDAVDGVLVRALSSSGVVLGHCPFVGGCGGSCDVMGTHHCGSLVG